MNINTSSITSPRPLGGQLDITSSAPAKPEPLRAATKPAQSAQVGTIANVLTEEENTAIAAMFQSSRQNLYTSGGASQTTASVPGVHLDIRA